MFDNHSRLADWQACSGSEIDTVSGSLIQVILNPVSALASPNSGTRFPAACGGVSEHKRNYYKGSKIDFVEFASSFPRRKRRGASIQFRIPCSQFPPNHFI
jgi:hypothetical protein